MKSNLGLRIFQVFAHKHVANDPHAGQRIVCLRDQFLPVFPFRFFQIDGDHAAIGRVDIGLKVQNVIVVADKRVFVFEVVD